MSEDAQELSKALSSERFARKMAALHAADSKELMYMSLTGFLEKTTRMVGLPANDLAIGYASQAENPRELIDNPLVGTIYQEIGREEVSEYSNALAALPYARKDEDYQETARGIIRASETRKRIREEYPGWEPAWDHLFDKKLAPVFHGLPNIISDPKRRQLFEALSAVVSGEVPPGLEDVEQEIRETHEAFTNGDTETLGDGLFGITSMLTQPPPPQPPGEPDDEEDDEDEDEEGSPPPGAAGAPGSSGGSEDPDEDEEDEQEEDEQEDEQEDESDVEEESPEESEEEPEEEQDPFEALGQYAAAEDDEDYFPSEDLSEQLQTDPPKMPDDIDLDKMRNLQEMSADIMMPKVLDGPAYLGFQARTPPDAKSRWAQALSLFSKENRKVRNIIDEHYRVAMQRERGLRSGRVDSARVHRLATNRSSEIFQRDQLDSIGNIDLVVLIDESGSMDSHVSSDGFKEFPDALREEGASDRTMRGYASTDDMVMGNAAGRFAHDRVSTARLMAMFLLDASKNLPGFRVQVAGYSSGSVPDELQDVANAVHKANEKRAARVGEEYHYTWWNLPVVRSMGDQKNPYPILSSGGFGGNADAQGLAYALDTLETSSAPQKAILYLADGYVTDEDGYMQTLFKKCRTRGVYPFFMNLSDVVHEDGALADLDQQKVDSFPDMLTGLQKFLHNLVARL